MAMLRAGMVELPDAVTDRGRIDSGWAGAVKAASLPMLVLGVLVWIVVTLFRSGDAPRPHLYAEFVDTPHGSYLDVQLDRSATSYGAFSAFLPGRGRVWPAARVEATPGSGQVVQLHYDGLGYQDPTAQPDGGSGGSAPQGRRPPQVISLRLAGQVDPAHHTASVDVRVNADDEHIRSADATHGVETVVGDFLAAVSTGDWDTLYGIEDPYMRNGSKRTDFVTAMAGVGAATRISDAEAIGPTKYSTTEAGVSYARIPVRLAYRTGTATTTEQATLVLVVDEGAWKVLSLE